MERFLKPKNVVFTKTFTEQAQKVINETKYMHLLLESAREAGVDNGKSYTFITEYVTYFVQVEHGAIYALVVQNEQELGRALVPDLAFCYNLADRVGYGGGDGKIYIENEPLNLYFSDINEGELFHDRNKLGQDSSTYGYHLSMGLVGFLIFLLYVKPTETEKSLASFYKKVNRDRYREIKKKHPSKDVIIADAGWDTSLRVGSKNVTGHFKMQPCGSNSKFRKLIWVNEYPRGEYIVKAGKERLVEKEKR